MRTGEQAIDWGRTQIKHPTPPAGYSSWSRICLMFVRFCFGVGRKYPDAGSAWDNAKHKHRTANPLSIPRGVPVFFETPGTADHIVVGLGGGLCLTNDFGAGGAGKISVARIADIVSHWNAPLLGWTEDLNGVRVYSPPMPEKPKPPAEDIRVIAARNDWREDGLIDTELLSAIRKSGHPAAAVIADNLPKIRARMAAIYDALDN